MTAAPWGLWLAMSFLAAGCASVNRQSDAIGHPPDHDRWQSLADSLRDLSPAVEPAEAESLASRAYRSAQELALEYRAIRPAVCQNILVNLGLKRRGLCYHWAEDMNLRLQELQLYTLQIDWAVARPGTWREHNSLAVSARGQPFAAGIVLDAWRHSGKLSWGPISEDHYPWQPVTNRAGPP